jgi:hypothetical protein
MTSLDALQPWLTPWAKWLVANGRGIRVTSTYRSYSEQLQLYLNRDKNRYPVAPPGRSWHQYGRAFDVSAEPNELIRLGALWRSVGGTWSERDPIHFQA